MERKLKRHIKEEYKAMKEGEKLYQAKGALTPEEAKCLIVYYKRV